MQNFNTICILSKKMVCTFLPAKELVGTILVPTSPICSDGPAEGKSLFTLLYGSKEKVNLPNLL